MAALEACTELVFMSRPEPPPPAEIMLSNKRSSMSGASSPSAPGASTQGDALGEEAAGRFVARPSQGRLMSLRSSNPGKSAAERLYLVYTPLWGAACGAVMLTGRADAWGDAGLLALGGGLWLILLVGGFVVRAPEDRGVPFYRLYHFKLSVFMALFAFLENYFGTKYFYEVLDMHYGFRVRWNLNDVPLFLYPLTAVYFTTYSVLWSIAVRFAGRSSWTGRAGALVAASLGLSVLETAIHANPAMKSTFCYGNLGFALWFGTIVYGTAFIFAGPCWHRIDERPGDSTPLRQVLASVLVAFALILGSDELYERAVAPHFTTVLLGQVGIPGKQGPSCLVERAPL